VASLASCAGGTGGSATGDTLPGVVLVSFGQAGQDNVPLNRVLVFEFSSPIDPLSINPDAIQIREGSTFGLAVDGKYIVQGNRVYFEPRLPGNCDNSDAGFQPDLDYRVTIVGAPEEFAVRSLAGDALEDTIVAAFHTRVETDPELFEDAQPTVGPTVLSTTPSNLAAGVPVSQSNRVVLSFSENLDPCSVSESTILFHQYATGDPVLGFVPFADQTPGDPFSWGSGVPTTPARRVRCDVVLTQDTLQTTVTLRPIFGEFPDNALLVVQVTAGVRDFGGLPATPLTFSFTTENRPAQTGLMRLEFDGDVPINENLTSAEVNSPRAPSKVQGFVLFAGDGDNGPVANLEKPSGPDTTRGPVGCTAPYNIVNDGIPDDFDPTSDTILDTGSSLNTCFNGTDGSTAVVFEYRSFRIRPGITVRLAGRNPAIILVQGAVVIEPGGRLFGRIDSGTPSSNGRTGSNYYPTVVAPADLPGGTGVAGGGDGGTSVTQATPNTLGGHGFQGYFMTGGMVDPTVGMTTGPGVGHGNISGQWLTQFNPNNRNGTSAGGAGHASMDAVAGTALPNDTSAHPTKLDGTPDGAAGDQYGDTSGKMYTPEAGSGGGAAGELRPWVNQYGHITGGSGGAGGGFIDITARGDIQVFGTIDAAGGMGGNGAAASPLAFEPGSGGGGGGSGGGIRLLTPGSIFFGPTTIVTVAGGTGGTGSQGNVAGGTFPPVANNGGRGGVGRLVLEDGDSIIVGIGSGQVTPLEGNPGFYRNKFDVARFQGGGLQPIAITEVIDVGPFSPNFLTPDQNYGLPPVAAPGTPRLDFVAGIPGVASRGVGKTGIFIEAKGFLSNPDGTVNLGSDTGWKSVGYFTDSGSELFPDWHPNATPPSPGDVTFLPPGNTGTGITSLNGRQYVMLRITFFLPQSIGPFDPGPYVDSWNLYFSYDQ
jgi:hypothetical protein